MSEAAHLQAQAQATADTLPALMAQATHLASTVLLGDHGRRRAGTGDSFWQYRPAHPSDGVRAIDWRRSARGDDTFVQDKEWQTAQSAQMWVDTSASMSYRSSPDLPSKVERARLLALATAIALNKGGERVGLFGGHLPPQRGSQQIEKLAAAFCMPSDADTGRPETTGHLPNAKGLLISDFFGDLSILTETLGKAADCGLQGAMIQILDPQEEHFPFKGRTIFQSMKGRTQHETLKADGLRDRYLDRLAARKDALASLAKTTGWHLYVHHTDHSALPALLWVHQTLSGRT